MSEPAAPRTVEATLGVLVRADAYDLDLMDATLERVAFAGCTAQSLTVRGARHTDTDLRGLDFCRIDETAGLRGATISEQQLSDLASVMTAAAGIRVAPA